MMRAAAAIAALGFLLCASGLVLAQTGLVPTTVTIPFGKTQTYQIAGATTAYALDGTIADVSAQNGTVLIHAVGSGRTTVIVVTANGTQSIVVSVPPQPAAVAFAGEGGSSSASASEGGSYVGSYSSSAGQINNAFAFRRQQGDSFSSLLLVNATYVSPTSSGQGVGFPFLSYEVGGPGHDVVYLDQEVTMSPLTFEDALIRGLHVVAGPWTFHGGVATIAQFGNFFIPTDAQWTAGLTRSFQLSPTSTLAANVYDIVNTPGALTTTSGGVIGSLLYSWRPRPALNVFAEAGLSRSFGYSLGVNYDDAKSHLAASFLEKPADFASLATDAEQGIFGTLDYNRTFSDRFNASANAQRSDYDLPAFRENSETGDVTANYALDKSVSVNAGVLYSDFASFYPTSFEAKTLGIPLGITYATKHFNAGVQWQPTTDFSGTHANGYGANAGIAYGPFAASGFYNHGVDIPTVSSIFSQVPGLQAALEAAGIDVTDPAQLAQLLNNAALLAKLGFAGLRLDLAPVQNTSGFNASWTGRGRQMQQVNFSYLNSASELTQGSFGFRIASLTYLRQLDRASEVSLSATYLRSNQGGGAGASVSTAPGVVLTFRHRFSTVPGFLFPARRGDIGGYVFRDDDQTGHYTSAAPGLPGVEVTLDDGSRVVTDASGHYEFSGIAYGTHRVAAQIPNGKPFSFTTDSPATAQIGSYVDFGVSFVAGKLFGALVNDAGAGVPGAVVQVAELGKTATTQGDGTFSFASVAPGHYTVTLSADSLPVGYDLATLAPVSVDLSDTAPASVQLKVRALRSISGTVTLFDARKGTITAARGMTVAIPQLGLTALTDESGAYAFRELPAGTFDVEIKGGGPGERRSVTLPSDPTTQTGIDFRVTIEQEREHGNHVSQ